MSIATIHVEQPTECHCCTSDKEVEICTLENCNYPLCKNCKKKAYKIDNRCPGCRRDIEIKISFHEIIVGNETDSESESESESDSESESEEREHFLLKKCNCKCSNFKFNRQSYNACIDNNDPMYCVCSWINTTLMVLVGLFIISIVGRITYIILYNDSFRGFFCEKSDMAFLMYIGTSIVGVAFSTCFLFIFCGIFRLCCDSDYD